MLRHGQYGRNIILSFVSVISVIGLTCTLDADSHFVDDATLLNHRVMYQYFIYSIRCASKQRTLCFLLTIFVIIILQMVEKGDFSAREKFSAFFLALPFSLFQLLGHSYSNGNSWDEVIGNTFVTLRASVALFGYITVSSSLILLAFRFVDNNTETETANGERNYSWSLGFTTLLLIIFWIPYYIYFFPGTSSPDTSEQIAWSFHYATRGLSYSALRGENIYFSNSHPFCTTLLFGLFAKLGVLFGNIKYGIAIYCLFQMILTAFVFSSMFSYLLKIGVKRSIVVFFYVFVSVFPLFPMYAICMVKDSLFSLFCLILTILLFEVIRTRGESFYSLRFCFSLSICCFAVILTKSQGVYLIAFAFALTFLYKRKVSIVLTMGIPVFLFLTIWLHLLLPLWNIAPGGKQELYGLLFQQTARYTIMYPQDVTKQDEENIRAILDFDNIAELYNPTLADPVKYTFNQDCTDRQFSEYLKTWWRMLSKHPDAYIQAFFNNMYGSFYLQGFSVLAYLDFDNRDLLEHPEICVQPSKRVENIKELKYTLPQLLEAIPAIGILFSVGFYPWIVLFVNTNAIRKNRPDYLVPLSVILLSVIILMVSPVSGSFRYNMPFLYTSSFLISICFLN